MFAAPPRCRPWIGPACAAVWGLSAVVLLTGLSFGLATGPWPLRATCAAGLAVAAAVWGWSNAPHVWRGWIAAAPLAVWAIGAFGWEGATFTALAAWIALQVSGAAFRLPGSPRREPRPGWPPVLHNLGLRFGLPILAQASQSSSGSPPPLGGAGSRIAPAPPNGGGEPSHDEFLESSPELDGPVGVAEDELEFDEPEPDQWFSRTADAVEGELLVRCEGGVGSGHVLFWPALPGVPRVHCHPADGLGRVRATRALPQGVRFEVVRPDGESGPVRVCYEAAV